MIKLSRILNVKGVIPRVTLPDQEIFILGILSGTDYNVVYMDPEHDCGVSLNYPSLVTVDGKLFSEWLNDLESKTDALGLREEGL